MSSLLHCDFTAKKISSPERITPNLKKEVEKFNTKGMKFPVEMRDIDIFEKIIISPFMFLGGMGEFIRTENQKKKEIIMFICSC